MRGLVLQTVRALARGGSTLLPACLGFFTELGPSRPLGQGGAWVCGAALWLATPRGTSRGHTPRSSQGARCWLERRQARWLRDVPHGFPAHRYHSPKCSHASPGASRPGSLRPLPGSLPPDLRGPPSPRPAGPTPALGHTPGQLCLRWARPGKAASPSTTGSRARPRRRRGPQAEKRAPGHRRDTAGTLADYSASHFHGLRPAL